MRVEIKIIYLIQSLIHQLRLHLSHLQQRYNFHLDVGLPCLLIMMTAAVVLEYCCFLLKKGHLVFFLFFASKGLHYVRKNNNAIVRWLIYNIDNTFAYFSF